MAGPNDKIISAQAKIYEYLVKRQRVTPQVADSQPISESMAAIIPDAVRVSKDDIAVAEAAAAVLDMYILSVAEDGVAVKCASNSDGFVAYSDYICVTNPYDSAVIANASAWARREGIEVKAIGVISNSYLSQLRAVHGSANDSEAEKLDDKRALQQVEDYIRLAAQMDASDIHFVPTQTDKVDMLYRIDGKLRAQRKIELKTYDTMVRAVIEQRCQLQLRTNTELAGKFELQLDSNKSINLRVSTVPAARRSETTPKMVLRLLGTNASLVNLDRLGMSQSNLTKMIRFGNYPNGMIVLTGPTGSGKTTTLSAELISMQNNDPNRNFSTIEDPVEMQHQGMTHIEVTDELTFAKGLRALLRQDPDVIFVGEMRDNETADLAYKAAQTGHLVLTTLHTNNSHESIGRLARMGIDVEMIATNTTAFLAQRLVRCLCDGCKIEYRLQDDYARFEKYGSNSAFATHKGKTKLFKANRSGCDKCGNQTGGGEKGRQGIIEILEVTPEVQVALLNDESPAMLRRRQIQEGTFEDLWDDGLRLVAEGVLGFEQLEAALKPYELDRTEVTAPLGVGRPSLVPFRPRPHNHAAIQENGLASL
ncbi:GspE/PulE family protein [Pseudomonas sp. MWU12-2323]|uniref:GspE/PulE family protein n=1 Tax=Pseudomonas sp. MWU12-2323 TaxID=2651296 RepID=UPI00128B3A68|nr:ATPase, T2SS/T4P/T4SS family [Pseudomonas sp. MWU12-2323]MPQ69296.1 type II/IV secretion system protein [Pseudomonas sp. MWU12-2323]